MNDPIRDFFEKHILPLHDKIEKGEINYLNMEFNNGEDSYFFDLRHPLYLYLSNISLANEAGLKAYFSLFWKNEPELLDLIPDLTKLAFTLKEENKEQSEELSPFVYAMF